MINRVKKIKFGHFIKVKEQIKSHLKVLTLKRVKLPRSQLDYNFIVPKDLTDFNQPN